MAALFSITRLVEVALADERSGAQLYRKMAEKAVEPRLKRVFTNLSATEQAHAATFEQMVEALKSNPPQGTYPDEYADYLDARCAQGGDSNAFDRIAQTSGDNVLLDLAMEFENEQLSIQQDISDALGGEYKDIVNVIIKEEKNHLVSLSSVKKQLGW